MATLKKYPDPFLFFRRGRAWTIVYYNVAGKKKQKATGILGMENKPEAEKLLADFTKLLAVKRKSETGGEDGGPLTVARWAVMHVEDREKRGVISAPNLAGRLKLHVLPHIGHLKLTEVTSDHVEMVMEACRKLAPRTQGNVYGAMRSLFRRAVKKKYMVQAPLLDKEDLPASEDKDGWRLKASFTKDEVKALITDLRIPDYRRVFYAALFLAGLRTGEAAALTVEDYEPEKTPLGRLLILHSYNTERRLLKNPKTNRARQVPVHPWLATILAAWLAHGWANQYGRPPGPTDILLPSEKGKRRNRNVSYASLQDDLTLLGFRRRRQHDARRTFISLAVDDGAHEGRLEMVTHGERKKDSFVLYRDVPWARLCEAVAKLDLGPPGRPNPLKTHDGGLPLGCHDQNHEEVQEVKMQDSSASHSDQATGQTQPSAAKRGQMAPPRHLSTGQTQPKPDKRSQPGQLGNLATLALRQALAALDKGRVDQAREIIAQAIEDERRVAHG